MSDLQPISAAEIMATEYPELRWAVEGIMPEGFALLAGRPKIGKSWLALNMAVSVAHGSRFLGQFPTERGRALYAALEDGPRRIKARLQALGLTTAPPELEFLFDLPKIDDGGLEALAAWFDEHRDTRLSIIDVFNRIRGQKPKGADAYQHDAEQAAKIQKVATAFSIPTLLVHHDRKEKSEDWVEQISGTLGTAGTADVVMLLTRERASSKGRLQITGRDLGDRDLGLEFKDGIWQYLGDGDITSQSPERLRILDAIRQGGAMKPAEIARVTGLTADSVRHTVLKMGDYLTKDATGRYEIALSVPRSFRSFPHEQNEQNEQ